MIGLKGRALPLVIVRMACGVVFTLASRLSTDAVAGKRLAKNLTNADDITETHFLSFLWEGCFALRLYT